MSFADGFDFAMGALAASALVSVPLALLVLGGKGGGADGHHRHDPDLLGRSVP